MELGRQATTRMNSDKARLVPDVFEKTRARVETGDPRQGPGRLGQVIRDKGMIWATSLPVRRDKR